MSTKKSVKGSGGKGGGGQAAMRARNKELKKKENVLSGATVYLSGPMDFVANRMEEKEFGWRNRIGQFLKRYGTTVYDPWNQPPIAGLEHYGKEDEFTSLKREGWSYDPTIKGARTRAELADQFWPSLHTDLRMTDTADFLIAFCPTNIYSVGTVHEVATARLQKKPVLLVTPPVTFPTYDELMDHLEEQSDERGAELLGKLEAEAPLRPNPRGIPSLWYMALIDGEYFFDGFGFAKYMKEFGWKPGALDEHEKQFKPKRPLLAYLERVNNGIPKRYNLDKEEYVENPEWLIFET